MLGKILLTLFLLCIIVLFVINASRAPDELETEPEDFNCIYTNPDDCSSYYNCLGAKIQCSLMERFDTNTMSCRTFYNVDCGTRPNPPDPTAAEICAPYHDGTIFGWQRYPLRHCQYFANCRTLRPDLTLSYCGPVNKFDDNVNYCLVGPVDCNDRCMGDDCPIPL
ncbi:hypothetical protein [Mocis latipes granulovirus]|uniref:Chitin-binding type-2 domain-containing protein n=1 Tax=Mocis latipes granulovirus TaxID=2072024 RepID=A0A162GVQ7_9BBAC|nr:hypothetical protein [Mocis latipes granulovirus]AKR17437.1 hypothetical protein [Mocis latipes granulovirus]